MKLSNNKRPPYNNQSNYSGKHQPTNSSQPSSARQQSQNHPAKNAPTPNGYDYNPYKIMGFQNKETNEYALNVLKNQNFDALPPTVLAVKQPSQPMPAEGFVPMPANRNFVVPPPATAVMAQPFIPAVINTQPYNWTWKEHDICFAKYWEDQRVSGDKILLSLIVDRMSDFREGSKAFFSYRFSSTIKRKLLLWRTRRASFNSWSMETTKKSCSAIACR